MSTIPRRFIVLICSLLTLSLLLSFSPMMNRR
jgi:hypothetical protein